MALVNKTVLAYGPLATTFTPDNIARAYGGVFNHLVFTSEAGRAVAQQAHAGPPVEPSRPAGPHAGR